MLLERKWRTLQALLEYIAVSRDTTSSRRYRSECVLVSTITGYCICHLSHCSTIMRVRSTNRKVFTTHIVVILRLHPRKRAQEIFINMRAFQTENKVSLDVLLVLGDRKDFCPSNVDMNDVKRQSNANQTPTLTQIAAYSCP